MVLAEETSSVEPEPEEIPEPEPLPEGAEILLFGARVSTLTDGKTLFVDCTRLEECAGLDITATEDTLTLGFDCLLYTSGMGLNAFFVYTVCFTFGLSYANGLVLVLVDGIVFVLLTVTGDVYKRQVYVLAGDGGQRHGRSYRRVHLCRRGC